MQITMYSKNPCPNCVMAERMLTNSGVAVHKVVIGGNPDKEESITREAFVAAFPDVRIAPALVLNGKYLGSLRDVPTIIEELRNAQKDY